MSNPAKSASDIDWDKMAKRLGKAFDSAMTVAENNIENNDDYSLDEDFGNALQAASRAADALVKIAAEARAAKEGVNAKGFSIDKPAK